MLLEWPNQHKIMQNIRRKVEGFVSMNYILMQHNSWKIFLIWYSGRKSIENIYVSLRIFKKKSLIGGSLLWTVLILAGNWTQVIFLGIIPLEHQDFCRYCQYRSNEQNQIANIIYMLAHKQEFLAKGRFLEIRTVR